MLQWLAVPRAFCINSADNVATLLDNAQQGDSVQMLGKAGASEIQACDPIELGHKIALRDIPINDPIVKFGVRIGAASRDILAGQWVHLHNCKSGFDERSQTLDLHTGAATDTKYQ